MAIDSPFNTYDDTTPQKRIITDVLSMIDPSDTVAIDALGGLDGASSKFRFVNGMSTAVEWLEDTLAPLTDTLTTAASSSTGAAGLSIVVGDASKFQPGFIIEIQSEQMWVSAVNTATETLTVTRAYSGSIAAHSTTNTVTIVGIARLEGDDSDPLAFTDRTTGTNYTQIFHQEVKVTRTHNQIAQYGISNEFDYQVSKAVPHLGRLLEKQIYKGARKAGSATTPRAFGGLATFITDNSQATTGSLTQDTFDQALKKAFDDGAVGPWVAFASSANMKAFKDILDSSSYLRYGKDEKRIGMTAEGVDTPYGSVDVVLDRWAGDTIMYLVDPSHAGLLTFYPFTFEPLAKDGDYEKAEVIGEFTLCVRQDKAHAKITGTF